MDDFGRRVGNSRTEIFKRVSYCSETENRNSGARGDCHLVPYSSLWTRHFFYLFLTSQKPFTGPEDHFGYEPGCRGFESLRARHLFNELGDRQVSGLRLG